MDEIRTKVIQKLSAMDRFTSPIAKIRDGRKYNYSPWIRAGFSTLVTRAEPLTEADGLELGIRDVVRCAKARETHIK